MLQNLQYTIFVIFAITTIIINNKLTLGARSKHNVGDDDGSNVYDWKPIPGPPSAFSITQSHPAMATSQISAASTSVIQHHRQQSLPPSPSLSLAATAASTQNHLRNSIINDAPLSSSSSLLSGSDRSYSLIDDQHNSVANSVAFIKTSFDGEDSSGGDLNAGSDINGDIISNGNHNEDIISSLTDYKGIKINAKAFSSTGFSEDACSVNKYAFDHLGTVTYKSKIPKLDQYTICFWTRYTNHSGDHTIFTYAVRDEPREIQIWIANSKGSSYVSMAIHGQSLYRLNYPMKMRTWHHTCTSWNGKTGEWQLWIKGERVGRGFHNRLVNHKIPTGGIAYSGGSSVTGPVAEGLHFEMTLLQIYKVALTAGKAHRNHKHHHVHRFGHDGIITTTTPPPTPPPQTVQVMNPLLVNGQIPTRVQINLATQSQQQQQQQQQQMLVPPVPGIPGVPSQIIGGILPGMIGTQNQATINTNFANGQFNTASRLLSQQLISAAMPIQQPSDSQDFQPNVATLTLQRTQPPPQPQSSPQIFSPSNAQYIDDIDPSVSRFIFKRDSSTNEKSMTKREVKVPIKDNNDDDGSSSHVVDGKVRDDYEARKIQKRGLIVLDNGLKIDEALLAHGYQFEGLAQFGLPDFKRGLQTQMDIEDEIKEHDKEPAEEEVKAAMNLCTACDVEPFKGAVAFAWKNAIVSLEHTLKGRSVGGCGYF